VKVGDLVKFVDHDAGAGFASPPEVIGLIVAMYNYTSPPEVEVLRGNGEIMFQYGDELWAVE